MFLTLFCLYNGAGLFTCKHETEERSVTTKLVCVRQPTLLLGQQIDICVVCNILFKHDKHSKSFS